MQPADIVYDSQPRLRPLPTPGLLGWPAVSVVPLGIVLLVCTALYALPQTTVLGAILLTAYLGGSVATHARIGSPIFSHMFFGIYLGVLLWGGLYLRDDRLRALIPYRLKG